jgi:hypothetical protein
MQGVFIQPATDGIAGVADAVPSIRYDTETFKSSGSGGPPSAGRPVTEWTITVDGPPVGQRYSLERLAYVGSARPNSTLTPYAYLECQVYLGAATSGQLLAVVPAANAALLDLVNPITLDAGQSLTLSFLDRTITGQTAPSTSTGCTCTVTATLQYQVLATS